MTEELQTAAQQADERQVLCDGDIEELAILHAPPIHTDFKDDDFIEFGRAVERKVIQRMIASLPAPQQATPEPIPVVLHCPKCGLQHVDSTDDHKQRWLVGDRALTPYGIGTIARLSSGTGFVEAFFSDLSLPAGQFAVNERDLKWPNEPHRSHLCHGCGTIWRPADVPTTGVKAISTKGKADTWEPGQATKEPVRGMIGMGAQALAGELADALNKDTQSVNSLGMLGTNTMAWLRKVAADYLSKPAAPEPVGEPFGYFRALPFGWEQCGEHDDGAVALYTRPAPGVPEGWRDAKNDPPPVGVDVLVAAEFDGPGDWRIKVGGRNPEQRNGWWVFGASWVPQVWMPLDAHRAMLAAAQAKGGEA